MAGRFRQLATVAAISAAALSQTLSAAPAPTPSPAAPKSKVDPYPIPGMPDDGSASSLSPAHANLPAPVATTSSAKLKSPKADQWDQARRLFEQLSPDQKRKFRDNLEQWKNMPLAQQDLFRDREAFMREKVAQEIQDAINKSGLRLDADQREVYALRYTQERRKIEERLRKEMDQKRQGMVAEMLGRLKVEFSPTPTPAPAAP